MITITIIMIRILIIITIITIIITIVTIVIGLSYVSETPALGAPAQPPPPAHARRAGGKGRMLLLETLVELESIDSSLPGLS